MGDSLAGTVPPLLRNMTYLTFFFVFVIGTAVGSFINVIIFRLGTGLGIAKSRSRCFSCGSTLTWKELVPVFSFLTQKGRCINCKAKISLQYPLVEIIAGVLFLAIFLKLGVGELAVLIQNLFILAYWYVIFGLLLAISVYDFRHKIIPNQFVYPFIALSLLSALGLLGYFSFGFVDRFEILNLKSEISVGFSQLIAGPLIAFPFAFFWFISKGRWMGFGDAKLALGIGWLLGLSSGVTTLVLSFWIGAIVSLLLIATKKILQGKTFLFLRLKPYTIKSEIPFGPFLALATLLVFLLDLSFWELVLWVSFM
jgi:leader peptidase (prepilin peptidase) / N-methyltransferase